MRKLRWGTALMSAVVFGFVCVGDISPPKSEAYPPRWNRGYGGYGRSVQISPRGVYVGPNYQSYRPRYYGGYPKYNQGYYNQGYYNRGYGYGYRQPYYGNNWGGSYYGVPYSSGFGIYTY